MKMPKFSWEQVRPWLLWIALPLVIGILASMTLPRPVIGIIRLNDAIYAYTAQALNAQIEYARRHPEVRAVVIVLDSPGGTVTDTEAVYMELTRLRTKKPVVSAVNSMAASGAYYLAVNTDAILAKPSSLVGNVGVIGYLPPTPFIFEEIISTGPYKLWGFPRDSQMRQIEMIKQGFREAVALGRGDRLQVPMETILTGQIWSGIEAARLGVIDELGSESDAVQRAARLARIRNYKTAELSELADVPGGLYNYAFFLESPQGIILPYPKEAGLYMLYIPQLPVQK